MFLILFGYDNADRDPHCDINSDNKNMQRKFPQNNENTLEIIRKCLDNTAVAGIWLNLLAATVAALAQLAYIHTSELDSNVHVIEVTKTRNLNYKLQL